MAERFIEGSLLSFFHEPDFSKALKIALLIAKNEQDPNQEIIDKLEWIKLNTTKRLKTPFYKIWNVVSLERNSKKCIEIINVRNTKEFTIGELVNEIQNAHQEMFELMGRICQKYDVSIPMKRESGGKIELPKIE